MASDRIGVGEVLRALTVKNYHPALSGDTGRRRMRKRWDVINRPGKGHLSRPLIKNLLSDAADAGRHVEAYAKVQT